MSDLRSKMIRLAASMPKGSSKRKALLNVLAASVWRAAPVTQADVAKRVDHYWSPKQNRYDPTMMGNSMATELDPLLVQSFAFDLAGAFYFSQWNKGKAQEVADLVRETSLPNAANVARNLSMMVFNSHSGSSQPSQYWGPLRYSSRLKDLAGLTGELRKYDADDVADWVESYLMDVEAIRVSTEQMIEKAVGSALKKLGLSDPSMYGTKARQ